ncbi:syntaxin-1A homolog [Leptinotarsa decemlineata]|uniref:syntaxin-1A homolog n=1 Tax=Leptinotarsa decemlineata TaxID=7539 RepID=UPI003D308576
MTRDRLGELLTVRNQNVILQKTENDVTELEDLGLRRTFERTKILEHLISTVERNIDDVRQIKRYDLGTNHKDLDDRIERIFVTNTSICLQINKKLKDYAEELKTTCADSTDGRIKFVQYNTLRNRFINIFKQNNAELENFRNIQKAHLEAQLKAKGIRITDEELTAILEEKADLKIFTENIIEESPETEKSLADIEEQYRQCLKIGQTLNEVSDLFIQMAILVDSQHDMVDRIDYQTELAKEFVERTPSILKQAARKKNRFFKCKVYCLVAVILLVIIIFVTIFKYFEK